MLLPEVIDRIRREREQEESRVLELPLPAPAFDYPDKKPEDEEVNTRSVIVIDL